MGRVDGVQQQVCQGLSAPHEDLRQSGSGQWRRSVCGRRVAARTLHRPLSRFARKTTMLFRLDATATAPENIGGVTMTTEQIRVRNHLPTRH